MVRSFARHRVIALAAVLFLFVAGCGGGASSDSAPVLPTTTLQLGGRKFVIEKAVSPGELTKGLMRRDTLAADHGMIFIFAQAGSQTFWNENVRFPLDDLFLDDSGRIVSIQSMKAYDATNTDPVVCRYVIEINFGLSQQLGLKVGDKVTLPADVTGQ